MAHAINIPGWRDRYRKAKFKNVEFLCESVTRITGRRQAVRKFPGRREVSINDLGEDSLEFEVSAYFTRHLYEGIGLLDHDQQRDRFEEVLLEPGPGLFVHPWRRGALTCSVLGLPQTEESKSPEGEARITFRLVVVEEPLKLTIDTTSRVLQDIEAGKVAQAEKLGREHKLTGFTAASRAKSAEVLQKARNKISVAMRTVNAQVGTVSDLTDDVNALNDDANTLIDSPANIATAIFTAYDSAFHQVVSTTAAVASTLTSLGRGAPMRKLGDALFSMALEFRDDLTSIVPGTATAAQETQNQDAIAHTVQTGCVFTVAEKATDLPLESREQALGLKADFLEVFDALLPNATEDYESLRDLQTSVSRHLSQVAESLPSISTFTPAQTMPAILIAQLVYGDASQEAEIVARNKIQHPGFTPQGDPLEIIAES